MLTSFQVPTNRSFSDPVDALADDWPPGAFASVAAIENPRMVTRPRETSGGRSVFRMMSSLPAAGTAEWRADCTQPDGLPPPHPAGRGATRLSAEGCLREG